MKPTPELLSAILEEVRPLIGQGKVADYIPALKEVSADKLGIAVCYNDGEIITAGDAEEPFSIQSISKVLSLTLALQNYQPEEIWQRVGKEPSGQAFNSMIQLEMEQGIPRNPFINAGAWWCATCSTAASQPRANACLNLCAYFPATTTFAMTKWWLLRKWSTAIATQPSPT